ncbi:MAG: DUF1553 domain-containing protein [Saprospiraceae bacterium]|nr:DUF1553 domain-containing protein [Saprospiraceae bacterium]
MKNNYLRILSVVGLTLLGVWGVKKIIFPTHAIDFNTDIRPILNQHCLRCHGGVKASGGLSFLFEEEAFQAAESGQLAIVRGKAGKSELIRRIKHTDPELRMPLDADPLSQKEIQLLSDWINQGAQWAKHWAYIPPKRPALADPATSSVFPLQNEIDHYILDRLQQEAIPPSPVADKTTLIRRLTLDLTGLPPTDAEVANFLADESESAIDKVIDRLLDSPHFGERWAAMWMDLARYGDSQGYQKDPYRSIWRYRDWLIDAFNEDLPFDQFTIQQLAGDLLPQPSEKELLATAFHRNTMTNDEGGTDDEEFRVAAVIDRINTTWEVWQGTTMSCVQCHSHPYDPFVHKDFYTSMAFFNNTEDADTRNDAPNLMSFSKADKENLKRWTNNLSPIQIADTIEDSKALNQYRRMALFPNWKPGFCDNWDKLYIDDKNRARGIANGGWLQFQGVNLAAVDAITLSHNKIQEGIKVSVFSGTLDGRLLGEASISRNEQTQIKLRGPSDAKEDLFIKFHGEAKIPRGFRVEDLSFGTGSSTVTKPETADSLAELAQIPTPIMTDLPESKSRKTHVFERGNWLVHGALVEADVPNSLSPLQKQDQADRLDLAQWLVDPENPLTARVIVNRFWAEMMGRGIVETVEDFGSQGTPPSHPALLDWLAIEFQQDMQWSIKKLLKFMASSSAYQQASITSPIAQEKDPNNQWWSRAYRKRLTAEQVRDQALAVSGLLSTKMYGPSVMPPQPDGVWQVIRQVLRWRESQGEDRYRRALYTFWRKSSPYPSFLTFDSPSREICVSRRIQTNTPLQALTTMNDTVYVEAARALAKLALDKAEQKEEKALAIAYEKALLKVPSSETLDLLYQHFEENLNYYQENLDEARKIAQSEAANPTKLAALTVVSNVILNLDEFVVRE